MMIYKEAKDKKYEFFWYLTDDAPEFAMCDNCRAEAPLHHWDSWNNSKWNCEICSNYAPQEECKTQAAVANLVLTMLGHFDNVEVLLASEHIRDYMEDSE